MNKFPGFPPEPATNYWPYPKILNGFWYILSPSEQKVLDYILRHTWGFKKTSDNITYKQFLYGIKSKSGSWEDKGCGISRPTLSKALKGLIKKGFIQKEGKERSRYIVYSLVKNLNQIGKETLPDSGKRTLHSIKDIAIKDKQYIKKDIPKGISRKAKSFPRETYNLILEAYQKYKGIKLNGTEFLIPQRAIKLMLRDERKPEEIINFMKWLNENESTIPWVRMWTIWTVRKKIAEFLAGKLKAPDWDDSTPL